MENLWLDSKRAVHVRSPSNLTQLEQSCKDEWSKIAVSRCTSLIETYPHRLRFLPVKRKVFLSTVAKSLLMWELFQLLGIYKETIECGLDLLYT